MNLDRIPCDPLSPPIFRRAPPAFAVLQAPQALPPESLGVPQPLQAALQQAKIVDTTGLLLLKQPSLDPSVCNVKKMMRALYHTVFYFPFPACPIKLTYKELQSLFYNFSRHVGNPMLSYRIPGAGGPTSRKEGYCASLLQKVFPRYKEKILSPAPCPVSERSPIQTVIYLQYGGNHPPLHEALIDCIQMRFIEALKIECCYDNHPSTSLQGCTQLIDHLLQPQSRLLLNKIQIESHPFPFQARVLLPSQGTAFLQAFDQLNLLAIPPNERVFHAMSLILYTFFDKSPLDLRSAILTEGKQYFTIEQTYTNATLSCRNKGGQMHTFTFHYGALPGEPRTTAETLYWEIDPCTGMLSTETDLQAILDVYEGCSRWIKATHLTLDDLFTYFTLASRGTFASSPQCDNALQNMFWNFLQQENAPRQLAYTLNQWVAVHGHNDPRLTFSIALTFGATLGEESISIVPLWPALGSSSLFAWHTLPEPFLRLAHALILEQITPSTTLSFLQTAVHRLVSMPQKIRSTVPLQVELVNFMGGSCAQVTWENASFFIPYDPNFTPPQTSFSPLLEGVLEQLGLALPPRPLISPSPFLPMSPIHTGSDAASLDGPVPLLVSEEALDLEEKGDLLIETAQETALTDTASPDESETLALALEENAVPLIETAVETPPAPALTAFQILYAPYALDPSEVNFFKMLEAFGSGDNSSLAEGVTLVMEAFETHFPALRDREKQRLLQRLTALTKASTRQNWIKWCEGLMMCHIERLCHYGISLWEASSASLSEEERLNEGFSLIREFAPKGLKIPLKVARLLLPLQMDRQEEWQGLLSHVLQPLPNDASPAALLQHPYDLCAWFLIMRAKFPESNLGNRIPPLCHALVEKGGGYCFQG